MDLIYSATQFILYPPHLEEDYLDDYLLLLYFLYFELVNFTIIVLYKETYLIEIRIRLFAMYFYLLI